MRKRGHYIIDYRLKFRKGLQKKFLIKVKERSGMKWTELAKMLNVHRLTLCSDWFNEKTTLPKSIANMLQKLGKLKIKNIWIEKELPPKWGQIKVGEMNKKRIKIPKKCEGLAEFLGSALGDGHLDRKVFNLSGNATEKYYFHYMKNLIKNLFNLESKIFLNSVNKNNLLMNIYSTELVKFLQKNSLVMGNKIKNKARLPRWIFLDKKLASAALRGLFDTDGGIYQKQKEYKRAFIEFQTASPEINKDIINLISVINLSYSKGNNKLNVRIQKQADVHKFIKIVGSNNLKNIIRYQEFLKNGDIPYNDKIERLMKDYEGYKT